MVKTTLATGSGLDLKEQHCPFLLTWFPRLQKEEAAATSTASCEGQMMVHTKHLTECLPHDMHLVTRTFTLAMKRRASWIQKLVVVLKILVLMMLYP